MKLKGSGGSGNRTRGLWHQRLICYPLHHQVIMYKTAQIYASKIFFTSDNSRNEDFVSIKKDALPSDLPDSTSIIEDREEAIESAVLSLPKDIPLLILGRGHEEFLDIKNKIIAHSDISSVKRFF